MQWNIFTPTGHSTRITNDHLTRQSDKTPTSMTHLSPISDLNDRLVSDHTHHHKNSHCNETIREDSNKWRICHPFQTCSFLDLTFKDPRIHLLTVYTNALYHPRTSTLPAIMQFGIAPGFVRVAIRTPSPSKIVTFVCPVQIGGFDVKEGLCRENVEVNDG